MRDWSATMVRPVRLVAPGVALIGLCYGIARFAYGLFVPAFRTHFDLSDTLLGVIGAGSYVGYCLAIVVAAAAVGRAGPRPVAAVAGIVATGGMALVAAAPTAGVLAAGVLLAGSSTGVASPPLAQALARWLPEAAQRRAQSVVNAGPGVGIALSGPVALLAVGSWRAAWLGFAILGGLVTAWIVAAIPSEARSRLPRTADTGRLTFALAGPHVRRLATAAATFGLASACTWTFGRDQLTITGGHAESTTIIMWILLGVAGVAGAAGGDLIARHGLLVVWRTSLVALALTTATIGLWPHSTSAALIAMAVFGASYMTLTIVVFFAALPLDPDRPAATVGLGFLMITAGQAVGAPLAGLLIDHAGATSAFLAFTLIGSAAAALPPAKQPRVK